MKKYISTAAALALSVAPLVGIALPSQAATKPVLTIGVPTGITSFAASQSETGNSGVFYELAYDTLVFTDAKGVSQPNLATSWKYSKDFLSLSLNLRKGVKFTDGTKFDAAAVIANINAFKNGASAEISDAAAIDSVTAGKDNYSVTIKLKDTDPALVNSLGRALGFMESPKMIGTAGEKSNPVGTGAYMLDSNNTVADSSWTYVPNPNYWDKKAQSWSKIVLKFINDASAQVNALKSGQIQMENLLDSSTMDTLKSAGFSSIASQSSMQMLTLVDRSGKMGSALKDVRIRQALNYAIDRSVLAKACNITAPTGGGSSVFPSGSKGYTKALDSYYSYNPAKAKALVAATGLTDVKIPTLDFSPFMPTCWAALTQMTAAAGITLYGQAPSSPSANIFAMLLKPEWPMFWFNLGTSNVDWKLIQNLIGRDASWNPLSYGTSTSDALIAKIRTSSGATQVKALQDLNAEVTKNAWFVPFVRGNSYFAYAPKSVKVTVAPGEATPTYPRMVSPK